MKSPSLFIYRSPSKEDLQRIERAQKQLAHIPTFEAVAKPHVTLLPGQHTEGVRLPGLRGVLYPMPETAQQAVTLPVGTIKLQHGNFRQSAYIVELGDPDGIITAEKVYYKDRLHRHLGRRMMRIMAPHLALGYVDPQFATADTLNGLDACIGTELTVGAIRSMPSIEPPVVPKPRPECDPDWAADIQVLTLRPNAIPRVFLASLQQATPQTSE